MKHVARIGEPRLNLIPMESRIRLKTIGGSYHSVWRLSPAGLLSSGGRQEWRTIIYLAAATLSGSPFQHSSCSPPYVAPSSGLMTRLLSNDLLSSSSCKYCVMQTCSRA